MAARDPYSTGRPALGKTALFVVLVSSIGWAIAEIVGLSQVIVIALIAVSCLLLLASLVWKLRRWQKRVEEPALLRKNLAIVLRTELPPGTLTTSGHRFGRLFKPGPPKKIIIKRPGMPPIEGELSQRIQQIASEICENFYIVDQKKSVPSKRIVLREKPQSKVVVLTPEQEVEQGVANAVAEIFPKSRPRISYEWDSGTEEPYLLSVTIAEVNGMELALSGKRRQILTKLRTRLPRGNFVADVDANADSIYFTRSRPLPNVVVPPEDHPPLLTSHQAYKEFFVPLGIGDNDCQAVWHPYKDAHLLIIGGTGGGKTIAEHGVIQRLSQAGWRTWLVDGKRVEFLGYQNWPNVEFLAQRVDEQIRLIKQAHDTMESRYDLIQSGKVRIEDLDPIVLVIDELTSLLGAVKRRYLDTKQKGMPTKDPLLDWLSDLARLGRTAKIHLALGLQRPDASIMGGEMRDNFGCRISLGKLQSKEASMMMWDDPAIGVSVPNIKGRAVSIINGQLGMVQGTYTANPDPNHDDYRPGMVEQMRPKNLIYTRKAIADPEPSGEDEEVAWSDIIEASILAEDGTATHFDPVSSEESKTMRQNYQSGTPSEHTDRLQSAKTFEEALSYFPYDPISKLTYGRQVAIKLSNIAEEFPPEGPRISPAPEPQDLTPLLSHQLEEGTRAELRYVEPGQNIVIDDIGDEEFTVSTCEPDPQDPNTYYLSGWTADGEAIHIELPADTTVEIFEMEHA